MICWAAFGVMTITDSFAVLALTTSNGVVEVVGLTGSMAVPVNRVQGNDCQLVVLLSFQAESVIAFVR